MVTIIISVTYIWNFFSMKLHWLHILVKLWDSIANTKRMMVLKFWTLEIKANLYIILAWISQLSVCIVCQYVCNAQKHAHIHLK